jgi:hypothetical protein
MMRGARARFLRSLQATYPRESRSGYRVPRRLAQSKMSLAPEQREVTAERV